MNEPVAMNLRTIPAARITAHPGNPRHDLGDLGELADSIRAVGILEPVVVRALPGGYYQLITGHRRTAAARQAGLTALPAIVRSPIDQTVAALVENGHRKNLTPVEQAQAFGRLRDQGHSQAEIARLTGYTAAHVSTRLALLDLDDATLDRIQRGVVRPEDALAAVRQQRGRTGPKAPRVRHFSGQHPLADTAHVLCEQGGHTRRYGDSVACGRCWEAAIRADERVQLGAEPAAAVVVDDVDEVAVRRFVDGDDQVRLNDAEYEEAFRQTVTQHGWNAAMARFPFSGTTAARVFHGRRSA